MQHLIATKSNDWSYEEEVRVVKEEVHGPYRGLIEFKRPALVEVIFGYKTNGNDIEAIKETVRKRGYSVNLFKMELRRDDFGLAKIPI